MNIIDRLKALEARQREIWRALAALRAGGGGGGGEAHHATHESGGDDAIKIDDLEAPDDNTDLDASTSKHGLLKKLPGGTTDFLRADGSFATPSPGAWGEHYFLDDFADESRYWTWVDRAASGLTVVESGSVLTLAASAGTAVASGCPAVSMAPLWAPCTIETKLNSYTVNDRTYAGLFIGARPMSAMENYSQGQYHWTYGHFRDVGTTEGIWLKRYNSDISTNSVTTLPVWLRVRVKVMAYSVTMLFEYSTNGTDWTTQYTIQEDPTCLGSQFAVGLGIWNWYNAQAISAPFEYFKVIPEMTGPDGV